MNSRFQDWWHLTGCRIEGLTEHGARAMWDCLERMNGKEAADAPVDPDLHWEDWWAQVEKQRASGDSMLRRLLNPSPEVSRQSTEEARAITAKTYES